MNVTLLSYVHRLVAGASRVSRGSVEVRVEARSRRECAMPGPRWVHVVGSLFGSAQEKEQAREAAYVDYLLNEDEFGDAERERRAEWEERERELGAEHPDTLAARGELAEVLAERGSFEEAEGEYRAVLDAQLRLLDAEHPDTLITRGKLAEVLLRRASRVPTEADIRDEAELEYRIVLDARMRALGGEHLDTVTTRESLADLLADRGKLEEAEREYRAVIE